MYSRQQVVLVKFEENYPPEFIFSCKKNLIWYTYWLDTTYSGIASLLSPKISTITPGEADKPYQRDNKPDVLQLLNLLSVLLYWTTHISHICIYQKLQFLLIKKNSVIKVNMMNLFVMNHFSVMVSNPLISFKET